MITKYIVLPTIMVFGLGVAVGRLSRPTTQVPQRLSPCRNEPILEYRCGGALTGTSGGDLVTTVTVRPMTGDYFRWPADQDGNR
jgi:hypothetical protein